MPQTVGDPEIVGESGSLLIWIYAEAAIDRGDGAGDSGDGAADGDAPAEPAAEAEGDASPPGDGEAAAAEPAAEAPNEEAAGEDPPPEDSAEPASEGHDPDLPPIDPAAGSEEVQTCHTLGNRSVALTISRSLLPKSHHQKLQILRLPRKRPPKTLLPRKLLLRR